MRFLARIMDFGTRLVSTPHELEPLGMALVLWEGNVHSLSLQERLIVAQAGGFSSISVSPLTLSRWRNGGASDSDIRRALAGAGVRVSAIDPLTKWLPTWDLPETMKPEDRAFGDFETDEVLAMARSFGAELVTAVEYTGVAPDLDMAVASFAALCDRALNYGVRVGLEPMPFSGICEVETAWEIVRRAQAFNGGLVLDSWHVFRGPDANRDLEAIRTVPGPSVFTLQLDDAPAAAEADLRAETMHRRLLPGTGALDLRAFLDAVWATGAKPAVGPEVFSDELCALAPAELGRRLRDSTRPFLSPA
jgi:sugar phosphate isomerase/epimerase